MMSVMTAPINMMPSVEPISEMPSVTGVGVVCSVMAAPVFCAAAKGGLKFASISTSTSVKNKKAAPKI